MKKLLSLALVLSLLVGFSGCNQKTGTPTQTTTDSTEETTIATEATTQAAAQIQQLPMAAVSVPVFSQSYCAQDGTVIFNHTYQNMSLIAQDPEVAEKVILEFLNRTDIQETVESLKEDAQDAYENGSHLPYFAQITYDPTRIDGGVMSMIGSYVDYSGGAHASFVSVSVNYDLVTGDALALADILTESADRNALCQLVLDALAEQEDTELYQGYETMVTELFSGDLENWYFSNSGLCFYFSPYEIGPYSSGVITAQIPYTSLTGIVKDAYFPAEREYNTGTVEADIFDSSALEDFSQFAEVVLAEDEEKIILYTDGCLYDIRLETGTWSADGQTFTPDHTVFAAYSLTPGDAIMVQADFDSALPALRLSYNSNGENESFLISAKDGNVTLAEN